MQELLREESRPGSPPPFKVIPSHPTFFTAPLEFSYSSRVLVISDQEFGKTLPLTKSLPQCLKTLTTVIARESITALFIVGNLVHLSGAAERDQASLRHIIEAFESLPLPIFVLASEYDRQLYTTVGDAVSGSNVRFVHESMIRLHLPMAPDGRAGNVFVTHAVHDIALDAAQALALLLELRKAFSGDIRPNDFLLIGHAHQYVLDEAQKVASIKDLSPDRHYTAYAVITGGNEGFNISIVGK
jgi:hypothetical protein